MELPHTICKYRIIRRSTSSAALMLMTSVSMDCIYVSGIEDRYFNKAKSSLRKFRYYDAEKFPATVKVDASVLDASVFHTIIDIVTTWTFFVYENVPQDIYFAFKNEEEATLFKLTI